MVIENFHFLKFKSNQFKIQPLEKSNVNPHNGKKFQQALIMKKQEPSKTEQSFAEIFEETLTKNKK